MITKYRRLSPTAIIGMLGATQIVGYGTVFYSFAILARDIAAEFRWPVSSVYGAFSVALVCGALAAPMVGRLIDRHGAPKIMCAGSLAVAIALTVTAFARGPISFGAGLVAVEVAAPLILYDAAFAAVVQLVPTEARQRITHLTLIAGFASTLFWPFTSLLHQYLDWREVLLLFAGLNLSVCLPLHFALAVAVGRDEGVVPDHGASDRVEPPMPAHLSRRVLWLVTTGFALASFLLEAILAQMVPMLQAFGLGSAALSASVLFGPSQVLVRFVNVLVGNRRHPLLVTIIAITMFPAAVAFLVLSAPSFVGAVLFATFLGFGAGLTSIVQGTLPLALFGSVSYGARLGWMAMPRQFLAAISPFILSLVMSRAGAATALMAFTSIAVLGLAAFVEVARLRRTWLALPLPVTFLAKEHV